MTILTMALACWRLSSLFVNEEGPFDIFGKFRHLIGIRYDENSDIIPGDSFLTKLFSCVWCVSVWFGMIYAGLYFASEGLAFWASLPFALSAGAILIEELIDGEG